MGSKRQGKTRLPDPVKFSALSSGKIRAAITLTRFSSPHCDKLTGWPLLRLTFSRVKPPACFWEGKPSKFRVCSAKIRVHFSYWISNFSKFYDAHVPMDKFVPKYFERNEGEFMFSANYAEQIFRKIAHNI